MYHLFTACMETHVHYGGPTVYSVGNVANPRECMRMCQYHRRCRFWSHHVSGNGCYMKDADAIASRSTHTDYFSGPKYCDDTMYSGKISFLNPHMKPQELLQYRLCSL